jgi:hypothetical protein
MILEKIVNPARTGNASWIPRIISPGLKQAVGNEKFGG